MAYSRSDLESLAKELQRDLTGIKTRLSDLQRGIASLPADQNDGHGYRCPEASCGLKFPTAERVIEHRENVHGVRAA